MNIERLEMMRVMLERVVAGSWKPTINFALIGKETTRKVAKFEITKVNLSSWADPIQHDNSGNICGFQACAIGHACFDEQFRELGLHWNGLVPSYEEWTNWHAVANFFDFSFEDTDTKLFATSAYRVYHSRNKPETEAVAEYPAHVRQAKLVANRVAQLIEIGEEKFNQIHTRY